MARAEEKKRSRQVGRHYKPRGVEQRPGVIFLLALLAALPIFVLFVVGQALIGYTGVLAIEAWPRWRALFYYATPVAGAAALWFYYKAPAHAREHNAARAGRNLAAATLALWLLFGGLYLYLFELE